MKIRTRYSISADGCTTTADGWPAIVAAPDFDSGSSHGFPAFQQECEAVVMGATTFRPALGASRWPWPDLDVFVLASERPEGTPDHVVVESDPATLLERIRAANRGKDVHLVGGPQTIETFRRLGALDEFGLLVLPVLLGPSGGGRLEGVGGDLTLLRATPAPDGAVDVVYGISAT
jgi:dihydrofolate reductase